MRALAPLAALLMVGTAGAVYAQSLAEVAKKERQRRSRTAGGERALVIGNDELERASGLGLSVIGQEPSEPDAATSGSDPDAGAAPGQTLSAAQVREYRETWARVWAQRMEAAEKDLHLAEDAVFQCQSASHFVFVPLAVDCNGVFERRAIAEYRLREIRQNRFNWELLLPERQRPPPSPP